jgi:hypothetical protein
VTRLIDVTNIGRIAIPRNTPDAYVATLKGLEPSTSAVTGRRSNQLSYSAKMVGTVGIEPTTPRV